MGQQIRRSLFKLNFLDLKTAAAGPQDFHLSLKISNRLQTFAMAGRVLSLMLPFLAASSSSLRGDGNYVDTVQCTGSGTLPMQPVP